MNMSGHWLQISFLSLVACVLSHPTTVLDQTTIQSNISDINDMILSDQPVILGSRFGEKYDEALEAIFSVAVRLEALLSDTNLKTSKNFLVSPLSMAVAVGELMLGTDGSFQDELYNLLTIDSASHLSNLRHVQDQDIDHLSLHQQLGDLMQNLQQRGEHGKTYSLKTASILFAQKNLEIKKEYKDNVLKFYGTRIRELDFERDPVGSEIAVNRWATESTNGLINTILPGPLPSKTLAILANAVYFRAEWEVPFSSEINREGVFKINQKETVKVTYMLGEFTNYRYVEDKQLNCRMVTIPYQSDEVSMHIIMPNVNNGEEYNINSFVQQLRTRDITKLINSAKTRKVTMVLPKMSLSNTLSMIEPLRKYHNYKMQQKMLSVRPLSPRARNNVEELENKVNEFTNSTLTDKYGAVNFQWSKISSDPRFQLSNIYQQMTLSVNEKGTEAAAITAGIIDYIMDSVPFRVDRPFLFLIRHEETQAVLFWGTVVDPTENNI